MPFGRGEKSGIGHGQFPKQGMAQGRDPHGIRQNHQVLPRKALLTFRRILRFFSHTLRSYRSFPSVSRLRSNAQLSAR